MVQVVPALLAYIHRVHLGMNVGFLMLRTCRRLALVLWSCVPSFCPLYRFALGVLSLNMVSFRVFRGLLAGFMGFVWVCMVLVLCVACVALYACGVRRLKGLRRVCLSFCPFAFLLLLLCLPSFMLVVLLCSGCLYLFSCIVFVVSFSLSDKTKKERICFALFLYLVLVSLF